MWNSRLCLVIVSYPPPSAWLSSFTADSLSWPSSLYGHRWWVLSITHARGSGDRLRIQVRFYSRDIYIYLLTSPSVSWTEKPVRRSFHQVRLLHLRHLILEPHYIEWCPLVARVSKAVVRFLMGSVFQGLRMPSASHVESPMMLLFNVMIYPGVTCFRVATSVVLGGPRHGTTCLLLVAVWFIAKLRRLIRRPSALAILRYVYELHKATCKHEGCIICWSCVVRHRFQRWRVAVYNAAYVSAGLWHVIGSDVISHFWRRVFIHKVTLQHLTASFVHLPTNFDCARSIEPYVSGHRLC